mmetsp:Transcript_10696/g.40000  ORF Transcript_10696/g.40000 Transcript_10696/m.40000 type:complete len:519 (-) Transcript_10696:112-1668(-)|eukprot:CAMPEP_0117451632 /NCGR_PEP_ID=MMETSP0759-20121206/9117_1 /TAXON_ID=63605 /ORGANISM="Percolomonas cosmopolitus, Strain WS" /LENGTH=518 /DNA_ID=CAMNT_0005244257 /DNA_START=635 /DNA_END=2191 /DNA_ORIENTATION=-
MKRSGGLPISGASKMQNAETVSSSRSSLAAMMQRETLEQADGAQSLSATLPPNPPYTSSQKISKRRSPSHHESHRYKSNHQPPIQRSPREKISSSSASYTQKNARPPPKRSAADATFLRDLSKTTSAAQQATSGHTTTVPEEMSTSERVSLELPRNLSGSSYHPQAHVSATTQMQLSATQVAATDAAGNMVQQQQLGTSSKQFSVSSSSKYSSPSPLSVNTFYENETNNNSVAGVKRMMITPSKLVRHRAFPFICSSFIPYSAKRECTDEDSAASTPMSAVNAYPTGIDETDPSFKKCFPDVCPHDNYDPYFLDDPEIRGGKQKKVMVMKGMITSTIPFVKSSELKNDLNDQFKRKHSAWFNKKTELTLSMIRQIKSLMIETIDVANGQVIEVSTVAMAFVYFEKLILQNVVTKQNRKIMASTCLFLAFKFNSESGGSKRKKHLQWFFEEVEHHFGISKKAILQNEFDIFARLQFDLNVERDQWLPHVAHIQRETEGKIESWASYILNSEQRHMRTSQ